MLQEILQTQNFIDSVLFDFDKISLPWLYSFTLFYRNL